MARTYTPLENFLNQLMVHRNHRGVRKDIPSNLVGRWGKMEELETGLTSIVPLHEYHYKKYHLFQETDERGVPVKGLYGEFHEKKITENKPDEKVEAKTVKPKKVEKKTSKPKA